MGGCFDTGYTEKEKKRNCDSDALIQPPPSCRRVNLALAYTELTEELGRVRELAAKQSGLLRHASPEPGRSSPSGDRQTEKIRMRARAQGLLFVLAKAGNRRTGWQGRRARIKTRKALTQGRSCRNTQRRAEIHMREGRQGTVETHQGINQQGK